MTRSGDSGIASISLVARRSNLSGATSVSSAEGDCVATLAMTGVAGLRRACCSAYVGHPPARPHARQDDACAETKFPPASSPGPRFRKGRLRPGDLSPHEDTDHGRPFDPSIKAGGGDDGRSTRLPTRSLFSAAFGALEALTRSRRRLAALYLGRKWIFAARSAHDVSGDRTGSSMKSAAIFAPHALNALTL
jgi:hypothetical protein